MKNLYIAFALFISGTAFGQIEQDVNKTSGTESNAINDIDSIRFNAGQTEMEIILNNGNIESHTISDINNVTFSGQLSVYCLGSGPTPVIEVTSPTGRIWMDRNLGATQVATSSTDANSYGDLYQWGRRSDGHQCRTSPTTNTLSSTDQPTHGDFIVEPNIPNDWRNPQNNNLWQGVNGVNNPCPSGFRIPTEAEFDQERQSWSTNNTAGAFNSPLKLTMGGFRLTTDASLNYVGTIGYYWSSTMITLILGPDSGDYSRGIEFGSSTAQMTNGSRAGGFSVRCIKDVAAFPTIDCGGATINGSLVDGIAASGVSTNVGYTGGNGGSHNGQTVTSTGVTGLTATLAAGSFANGSGTLTYAITGTPSGSGTASFALNIGGQSCTLNLIINGIPPCLSVSTTVVDVTSPATGRIWMDRNLGATQAATSSNDANAYGDLYQWGRGLDGHQCRTSTATSNLSSADQPANGNFIRAPNTPYDWRNPQNTNLWQGVNGVNNPCPSGYRLPTDNELDAERVSWSSLDIAGAFASPLKLTAGGYRTFNTGVVTGAGIEGNYWSSTILGIESRFLGLNNFAIINDFNRAGGYSVRCIKD